MFLHVSIFILFIDENASIVWMQHSLFIHFPADEHLGYFQIGVIMNKASMNIGVDFFVWM